MTDYVAMLREISKNTRQDRTDKTDQSSLVSLVSSPLGQKFLQVDSQEVEPDPCLDETANAEIEKKHAKTELTKLTKLQETAPTPEAETGIRKWLSHIGETDPEIVVGTIQRCRVNPETRAYFLGRSREISQPAGDANDDRRYCRECANLAESGFCRKSRVVTGAKDYRPIDSVPRRCDAFVLRTEYD